MSECKTHGTSKHILACAHLGNQYVCLNSQGFPYCVDVVCDAAERERLFQEAFRTGWWPWSLHDIDRLTSYPTLEAAREAFDAKVLELMAGKIPTRFDRRHGGAQCTGTEARR